MWAGAVPRFREMENSRMFCRSCGYDVGEAAHFCSRCGQSSTIPARSPYAEALPPPPRDSPFVSPPGSNDTASPLQRPPRASLLHSEPFALFLIKRYPIRYLALLAIAGASAFLSTLFSIGQLASTVAQAAVSSTHTDSTFTGSFFQSLFQGTVVSSLTFLAVPFFVASLFTKQKPQGEDHPGFARRFMRNQFWAVVAWAFLAFYWDYKEFSVYRDAIAALSDRLGH